ncbi:hypothetical protein CsSME_00014984 [Camellia sinensis var. sinensis]
MVIECLMAMSLELYASKHSEMIAKFEKLHHHKFLGVSNPYEAEAWLRQIKKLLDTSDIRNEQDRVTMAAFQMERKQIIGEK